MMYSMNTPDRIESFARRKCPRTILSHLLTGNLYTTKELRAFSSGEKPFCIRTVRYWIQMLVGSGYLKDGVNVRKDMRIKFYHIPQEMLEPVEELLRRLPEDECQRLQ